jgi:hypothetical protein
MHSIKVQHVLLLVSSGVHLWVTHDVMDTASQQTSELRFQTQSYKA